MRREVISRKEQQVPLLFLRTLSEGTRWQGSLSFETSTAATASAPAEINKKTERDMMQRGRLIHWAVLVALALAAGLQRPAHADYTSTLQAFPQDKGAVLVTWQAMPAPGVVGYNVYRRAATLTADKATLVNTDKPVTATSMTDTGAPLGTPVIYFMRPVFQDSAGKSSEGAMSGQAAVTPQNAVALPPGNFLFYNIDTLNPGSVTLDASNVLTIRASGPDLWSESDGQTFVGMPVSGDYQITAAITEAPTPDPNDTNPNAGAKFGVEIRSGPAKGELAGFIFTSDTRADTILYEGRQIPGGVYGPVNGDGNVFSDGGGVLDVSARTFPFYLRLLKQGTKITAFWSEDVGKTYTQLGDTHDFPTLGPVTYAGVFATAATDGQYDSVKFDATTIKIEPK
jgi:hypothetical protein